RASPSGSHHRDLGSDPELDSGSDPESFGGEMLSPKLQNGPWSVSIFRTIIEPALWRRAPGENGAGFREESGAHWLAGVSCASARSKHFAISSWWLFARPTENA